MNLRKIEAATVVGTSATSRNKANATRYIQKLTELMPGKLFKNCLPGYKF